MAKSNNSRRIRGKCYTNIFQSTLAGGLAGSQVWVSQLLDKRALRVLDRNFNLTFSDVSFRIVKGKDEQ